MSGTTDKSSATSKFDVVIRKQRGLLTKEERQFIALQKGLGDAEYAAARAAETAKAAADRAAKANARVEQLRTQFEAAKAALEAK